MSETGFGHTSSVDVLELTKIQPNKRWSKKIQINPPNVEKSLKKEHTQICWLYNPVNTISV